MPVMSQRSFFSLRLGEKVTIGRFGGRALLRWRLFYLRYHRFSIVRKRLSRLNFNDWRFFFGGNGGQNCNSSDDPQNCGE